ncbi:C-type lectin-like [Paroedura picta]|uniref:C-type lectin-like n=1 Tax=Paroedura picta TaxID=143630 RepID=UPI004056B4E4
MGLLFCFSLAALGLLVAGPLPRGVGASSCPGGWVFYRGSCYGFFQDEMTWAEAEIECQSLGRNGHLASIASQDEGMVLAEQIKADQKTCINVWIGLRDSQKNGRWRWTDRSLLKYKAWLPGLPDNYHQLQEYCAELWCKEGYVGWNDVNCSAKRPYICQFEV